MAGIPFGASFHWNPYSPKYVTVVATSPPSSACSSVGERSISSTLDDEECDIGWSTVNALRCEGNDVVIRTSLQTLQPRALGAVLATLESSPKLVRELCERERGNVVVQLFQFLGGDVCARLFSSIVEIAIPLAYGQSGCVAISRIYDAVSPRQQQVLSSVVMSIFVELSTHPFGNYVVQRVLEDAPLETYVQALAHLVRPEVVDALTTNKFGSHVIEVFVKHAPGPLVLSVCHAVLRDADCVVRLAFDRIGNYSLQTLLRLLLTIADTSNSLATWCHQVIPTLVSSSPYALNISRALGYQSTRSDATRRHS